jgi:hypothetical protein
MLGLPADWRGDETATETIGDNWVASGASLRLWVPSCIEPSDRNPLLNLRVPQQVGGHRGAWLVHKGGRLSNHW